MGEFILNGRNYGGSIITPNPSDTPTDTLDSIKIGDTTYEIQGGGGGGLQYFIESENALYGINDDAQYMRNDLKFKHTAPAVFTCYVQNSNHEKGYAVHTCPNVDNNDIVGIRGSRLTPLFGNQPGDGIFIISKDPTHCYFTYEEWKDKTYPQTGTPDYSDSYNYSETHNVITQLNCGTSWASGAVSDSFTFNGETYYIVVDGQYIDWWTTATEIETEYKWFYQAEAEYSINGTYQTVGAYGLAIMQANKASTKYNGISRNGGLAFFAGANDADGTNAPIKIFDNGTAEGLATTADLALKQDKLIAGDNISIGSNGKTISATNTDALADLTDTNINNPENGEILKYDGTNQKWINGRGGGGSEVIPNPQGTATDTLHTVDIDGIIYKIEGEGLSINPTLSNGVKIADYSVNGINGELYAPLEQYNRDADIVGRWFNGKPVRRTLFTPNVSLSNLNLDVSDLDIESIIKIYGLFDNSGTKISSLSCGDAVGLEYANDAITGSGQYNIDWLVVEYTRNADIVDISIDEVVTSVLDIDTELNLQTDDYIVIDNVSDGMRKYLRGDK